MPAYQGLAVSHDELRLIVWDVASQPVLLSEQTTALRRVVEAGGDVAVTSPTDEALASVAIATGHDPVITDAAGVGLYAFSGSGVFVQASEPLKAASKTISDTGGFKDASNSDGVAAMVEDVHGCTELDDEMSNAFIEWVEAEVCRATVARANVGDTHDLALLADMQVVVFNHPARIVDKYKGRFVRKNATISVSYFIEAAYSFGNTCDFYLVHEEITLPNGSLWEGRWKRTTKGIWRNLGFPWYDLHMNASMGNSAGDALDRSRCAIINPTPATQNNRSTAISGISWNIGGDVGYSSANGTAGGLSGGVGFQSLTSFEWADVEIINQSSSNGPNAAWHYEPKHCTYLPSIDISDPPNLAISTAVFHNYWIWQVKRPAQGGKFTLSSTQQVLYAHHYFCSTGLSTDVIPFTLENKFVLRAPGRDATVIRS